MSKTLAIFFTYIMHVLNLVFLVGCASATVTYFRDPASINRAYSKIAVTYLSSDLVLRAYIETETSNMLRKKGVSAVALSSIYSPTEVQSAENLLHSLTSNGIELLLAVTDAASNTSTSYMGFANTNYSTGTTSYSMIPITSVQSTANVQAYDVEQGKNVWVATANGRGERPKRVYDAMIEEVIAKMLEPGLLSASSD